MQKLVKPVRELDAEARRKVEEALGTPLADDSDIEFTPADYSNGAVNSKDAEADPLAMYRIFEGLPEEEVEDIIRAIRTPVRFGNSPE